MCICIYFLFQWTSSSQYATTFPFPFTSTNFSPLRRLLVPLVRCPNRWLKQRRAFRPNNSTTQSIDPFSRSLLATLLPLLLLGVQLLSKKSPKETQINDDGERQTHKFDAQIGPNRRNVRRLQTNKSESRPIWSAWSTDENTSHDQLSSSRSKRRLELTFKEIG